MSEMNLYTKAAEREGQLIGELMDVRQNEEPMKIISGDDEFDNEAWLKAELDAVQESINRLATVVTPTGNVVEPKGESPVSSREKATEADFIWLSEEDVEE